MGNNILDRFKSINHEEEVLDTGKKVKVGIIGTGWIAEAHVKSFMRCPDVEIVAVSDAIEGKAEIFLDKLGIKGVHCYLGHKHMLSAEKLDAVSVCAYNKAHAECSIDALKHGVNVLCEKPMAVTLEDAIAMCKAEKESGKILSVGFQPRMAESMKMIKRVVDSGVLGDVYYIQSGGGRRQGIPTPFGTSLIEKKTAGVGAVGDIGCYSLDMLLNAIGYPKPLTVTGYKSDFFGKNPASYEKHPEYAEKFSVDDFAAAFVRLEGGVVLDFRISWAMHMDTTGDALILGTKGGLRIPSTPTWNGSAGGSLVLYQNIANTQTETVIPCEEEDIGELFYKKIRSFVSAVKTGGTAPVPAKEILYNQVIIDAIVRSADCGKEVTIEIPEF